MNRLSRTQPQAAPKRFPRARLFTLTALTIALISGGCRHLPPETLSRFEFNQPQMGVPFRIVLYASDNATADASAQAAFERINQLNGILSDYDLESELSRLSRGSGRATPTRVSQDLWLLLRRAQFLSRESDGAFDITIGPVVNLWRKARRDRKFPTAERLARARQSVGFQHLELFPATRSALLRIPDMRLDMGGIAKGYAVDAALEVLATNGIRHALVSGGGDLAVSAAPPGREAWTIEIAPIELPNAPPAQTVFLTHAALATSGDLFQNLELDGKRYSHIVDPRTGIGLTHRALVTVVASDCLTADSLATAASVLGPAKGLEFIERQPDSEAQIVFPHGNRIETLTSTRFQTFLDRPELEPAPEPNSPHPN